MNQKKKTKEERYLEKLYELALKKGDPHHPIDSYEVGKATGENPKGTQHSVQMLAKNGFIKRLGEDQISLTSSGLTFLLNNLG